MSSAGVVIRKYFHPDRQQIRQICCDTAFMGEPCANFFYGDEVFADLATKYFTNYEPQSCFVAEKEGRVVGYLIGAKDTVRMDSVFARKIAFRLLIKAFLSGVFFKPKNLIFLFSCLRSKLKGEFRQPDISCQYPATLHININSGFRGLGIGSRLLAEYLAYLRESKVKALHLATMSQAATRFFDRHGFKVLFRRRRSYFRHLLQRDIFVYVYGKKL